MFFEKCEFRVIIFPFVICSFYFLFLDVKDAVEAKTKEEQKAKAAQPKPAVLAATIAAAKPVVKPPVSATPASGMSSKAPNSGYAQAAPAPSPVKKYGLFTQNNTAQAGGQQQAPVSAGFANKKGT